MSHQFYATSLCRSAMLLYLQWKPKQLKPKVSRFESSRAGTMWWKGIKYIADQAKNINVPHSPVPHCCSTAMQLCVSVCVVRGVGFSGEMRAFRAWQQTGTGTSIRHGGTKQHAIWPDFSRVSITDLICMLRSIFMHQRKHLHMHALINISSWWPLGPYAGVLFWHRSEISQPSCSLNPE